MTEKSFPQARSHRTNGRGRIRKGTVPIAFLRTPSVLTVRGEVVLYGMEEGLFEVLGGFY